MSRTSLAASFAVAMSMGSPLAAAPAKPVTVVVLTRPTTVEAAAQPDAATVAEAMRYLDAVDFDGNAMRTTELVVGTSLAAMVDGLRKQFGDVPEDLISQIKTAVRDHAMKSMRETLPELETQDGGAVRHRIHPPRADPPARVGVGPGRRESAGKSQGDAAKADEDRHRCDAAWPS